MKSRTTGGLIWRKMCKAHLSLARKIKSTPSERATTSATPLAAATSKCLTWEGSCNLLEETDHKNCVDAASNKTRCISSSIESFSTDYLAFNECNCARSNKLWGHDLGWFKEHGWLVVFQQTALLVNKDGPFFHQKSCVRVPLRMWGMNWWATCENRGLRS